jgi:hypothetical protein
MRKKTSRSQSGSGASFRAKPSAAPAPQPASERAPAGLVVAVELGADFPALAALSSSPRRVLAQMEGENPAVFADRVANTLDEAFGRGVPLGYLTLACNERTDDAALSARRRLAGFALGAMARQKSGRVSLSAPARSSGRLRHALSLLAQGLHDEWRTAGLDSSVDFGDEAPATTSAAPFIYTARVA